MHAKLKRFTEHMKRSEKTFAEHTIEQRLNQGLFRSWRCKRPNSWNYGFDVTTIPGSLIVTGDMGVMVFEREADMLPWLNVGIRNNEHRYMAGKVQRDIKVYEYCVEVAREAIAEIGRRIKPDSFPRIFTSSTGRMTYQQVKERFKTMLGRDSELDIHDEHSVKSAIYESGFCDGDFPSLDDYTSGYLWIYSALKWFVANLPPDPPPYDPVAEMQAAHDSVKVVA